MSTFSVPPELAKKEFGWKRLLIKAAGFGAGFALMLCLIAGVGFWYWNRPKPPKPWNNKAIKAEYYNARAVDDNRLAFAYVLENTTDTDYSLDTETLIQVTGFLEDTGSVIVGNDIKLNYPVFVPAKHKSKIVVTTPDYGFSGRIMENASDDQRHAFNLSVSKHVALKMANLNGFTIFDELNKYEIVLPNGWKKEVEKAAKK